MEKWKEKKFTKITKNTKKNGILFCETRFQRLKALFMTQSGFFLGLGDFFFPLPNHEFTSCKGFF